MFGWVTEEWQQLQRFTAYELNWTDPHQVDPVTRRVTGHVRQCHEVDWLQGCSSRTQFSSVQFVRCEHSLNLYYGLWFINTAVRSIRQYTHRPAGAILQPSVIDRHRALVARSWCWSRRCRCRASSCARTWHTAAAGAAATRHWAAPRRTGRRRCWSFEVEIRWGRSSSSSVRHSASCRATRFRPTPAPHRPTCSQPAMPTTIEFIGRNVRGPRHALIGFRHRNTHEIEQHMLAMCPCSCACVSSTNQFACTQRKAYFSMYSVYTVYCQSNIFTPLKVYADFSPTAGNF